jgi:hypothetical protein
MSDSPTSATYRVSYVIQADRRSRYGREFGCLF